MKRAQLAFAAVLTGYFGLLGLWLAWSMAPIHQASASLSLAVFVLPLLIPMRGLLDNRRTAYILLGLLSLFYFIHGVGAAYVVAAERPLAIIEIVFSLLLFGGALARLRMAP